MRLDHITPKVFGCRGKTHPRILRDLTGFPSGNRALEPPDPIPNSEVKWCIADDSVGPPHAKVGHRQGLISKTLVLFGQGFFSGGIRSCQLGIGIGWIVMKQQELEVQYMKVAVFSDVQGNLPAMEAAVEHILDWTRTWWS